eukprot:11766230-Ditylum_brightwellii.AAC.1
MKIPALKKNPKVAVMKAMEAAEDMTYQQVVTKKEKKVHKLILKGLLAVPPDNGSSRADETCSEGTIEGYPIILDGESEPSRTTGQPTTVPSNNESNRKKKKRV